MSIEGLWWYLVEEEAFAEERTAQWRLADGVVVDGRTGERLGGYEVEKGRVEISLDGKRFTIEGSMTCEYPTLVTMIERHPPAIADDDCEEMILASLMTRAEAVVAPLPLFEAA